MSSIIQAGLRGIFEGLKLVESSAEKISRGFTAEESNEPVNSILQLQSAERQVQASAKIIRASDDLEKAVLDLLA